VLSLDKLPFTTMVTTHSANSWTTDSGPGASVYASGENGKIDNEAVSFNVESQQSVETILEAAKKEGYAVGLVTTTRITHATPAAFASHTWFRDLEDYIASQYISANQTQYKAIYNDDSSFTRPYNPSRDWQLPAPKVGVEVDVLLGGGLRHFYPNGKADTLRDRNNNPITKDGVVIRQFGRRSDNVNLITYAKKRGYVYINSRNALLNIDSSIFRPGNKTKLLGLFNASHMAYEQDRQLTNQWEPSLFEMVEAAIKVLKVKGGKKGFFLMVEGGRIDHLEHANTGGIEVVAGSPNNQYTISADKPAYLGGGDANYSAAPGTARNPKIYGSDYLIKEVLAFDYAIAQGG
jgi:alkaline phosphatase